LASDRGDIFLRLTNERAGGGWRRAFSSGKVRAAVKLCGAERRERSPYSFRRDTDIDAAYVQEGAAITTREAGNVSRAEFPDVVAKFARILMATLDEQRDGSARLVHKRS